MWLIQFDFENNNHDDNYDFFLNVAFCFIFLFMKTMRFMKNVIRNLRNLIIFSKSTFFQSKCNIFRRNKFAKNNLCFWMLQFDWYILIFCHVEISFLAKIICFEYFVYQIHKIISIQSNELANYFQSFVFHEQRWLFFDNH